MKKNTRIYTTVFIAILLWTATSIASTVEYLYDINGRLIQANYTTLSILYTYDKAGNLLRREITEGGLQNKDSDGDGIDDDWELKYFGDLNTANQQSDFDKDGYSDLQEFLNQQSGENDPQKDMYDPTIKNAPNGTGYFQPNKFMLFLPAILKKH